MGKTRIANGGQWQEPKKWRVAANGQWQDVKTIRVSANGQWHDMGINTPLPTVTALSVAPDTSEPYLKFRVVLRTSGVVPMVAVWCGDDLVFWGADVADNASTTWWMPDKYYPKPGQTYTFRVAVSWDKATSTDLPALTTSASLPIPPGPSGITVQDLSNRSFKVKWNPVSNLGFYTINASGPSILPQQTVLGYEAIFNGSTVGDTWTLSVAANVWGQLGAASTYTYTTKLTYERGWHYIPCVFAATYSSSQDKWRPQELDLFHGNGGNWTPNHNMQHTSFYYVKDGDPFAYLRGAVDRGAYITACHIRIARKGMGYDQGIPLVVQTHNNRSFPVDGSYPRLDDNKKITDDKIRRNSTEWITIPTGFARDLVAGRSMGIHVGRDSKVKDYFMNFEHNVNVTGTLRIAIT